MKQVFLMTFFLVLLAGGTATAVQFGPVYSEVEAGKFYLGAGYIHLSADLEANGRTFEVQQNQLFTQIGLGLGNKWEVYLRGGAADFTTEKAFRFSNSDFEGDFLPFGAVGIKGPMFTGKILSGGPFLQAGYFSLYDDQTPITTTLGSGTEKIYFDNMWKVDAGFAFQAEIEEAYLYGGPLYYISRSEIRSVGTVGTTTDVAKSDLEEKGSLGAFIGINWPITRALSFDLEAVMRSDVSIGAALYYAF